MADVAFPMKIKIRGYFSWDVVECGLRPDERALDPNVSHEILKAFASLTVGSVIEATLFGEDIDIEPYYQKPAEGSLSAFRWYILLHDKRRYLTVPFADPSYREFRYTDKIPPEWNSAIRTFERYVNSLKHKVPVPAKIVAAKMGVSVYEFNKRIAKHVIQSRNRLRDPGYIYDLGNG